MQFLDELVDWWKRAVHQIPKQPQWEEALPAEKCHAVPAVTALPVEQVAALLALEDFQAAIQSDCELPAVASDELIPRTP